MDLFKKEGIMKKILFQKRRKIHSWFGREYKIPFLSWLNRFMDGGSVQKFIRNHIPICVASVVFPIEVLAPHTSG